MRKTSIGERLRYAFDNTMSKGPGALILWLALISVGLILVIALVVWLGGFLPGAAFVDLFWMSLMRTLDPGTMGGDSGSWPLLLSMLAVTLGGIFVISTLIGVLTTGIEAKVEELRKGRSRVIETGHTTILGWSEHIYSVLSELVVANTNRRRSCIVVLAQKDRVEMEDEIRSRVRSTGRTRIVCRTGNPTDPGDLEIVSLPTARSIIVMSPENGGPDADVIKTMLAILNNPRRRLKPYHIVAEIRDPKNMEVARLVGRDEVELVMVGGLISRIIAQTCRQSGLSVVYTELLDFGGDEVYFKQEPGLVGKTFGEALLAYEDSAVIGLFSREGLTKLNPPMDTPIREGDQLIAISADDDTIQLSGRTDLDLREEAIQGGQSAFPQPERTLILGWNWRAPTVINELDHYVALGSEVTVVADYAGGADEIARYCEVVNQTVAYQQGDTTDRRALDALAVDLYDHVIVLCYSDTLEPQQADARTLVTLLHLRDIAHRSRRQFSIVSEMLDVRNRDLAEVARADDFIVSDKLVSLMLAQVSESKALNAVFEDLFNPEGAEVYLKPASSYVQLGQSLTFYTVVQSARRRGEVALGYRLHAYANDRGKAYGVVINPDKADRIVFGEKDRVIVLSEQ